MYIFCSTQPIPLGKSIPSYPFCGSKTHIHFRCESEKTFDLLGFFREQSNRFAMHRLTKLVHTASLHHPIPSS